jgi:hypothetical protein
MQPEGCENRAAHAAEAHQAIGRFLAESKAPALLEPGESQMLLSPEAYEVAYDAGRLTIQVWDRHRTILRRVTRLLGERAGELDLEIERFGKKTGTMKLLDTARPRTQMATRRGERLAFREAFRRSVARQFPGWKISDLSTEPDLEHSLSPAYSRALVRKGPAAWAVLGAAPESLDVDGALTFGLIWFNYVVAREPKLRIEGLSLFLPERRERTTCLRVRHLEASRVRVQVFVYGEGTEQKVELADYSNLDTQLTTYTSQFSTSDSPSDALICRIAGIPGADTVECPDGSLSLRIRGMEFARKKDGELRFGLETKTPAGTSNFEEVESLARHLSAMRVPDADRQGRLYTAHPELWLESQVRRSLAVIDASLLPRPVYGQVPAFAGADRGVIDLLACDAAGRLVVIELKASADVHLPLQALDYWMRVRWHAERDEFAPRGYFPGVHLSRRSPRLLLVAPALEFHPATETILQYFSSDVEVERVGVGVDWRRELQAVFRLTGSESRA